MFERSDQPRVFGVAPGCDFPAAVVEGLRARLAGAPPEAMARVELFVNTRRMGRRIRDLFTQGPACFLPRIRLVTDLAADPRAVGLPPVVPPLRRRLQLAQLIRRLLQQAPDLAPQTAVFELADSLAGLLDEMQGEGVAFERLAQLDVAGHSAHWERSLKFLSIVAQFLEVQDQQDLDPEARQRAVVERLIAAWNTAPPRNPVIVAGSTGSRGTTALFMEQVARLPQGALILPGYDFDMPPEAWQSLSHGLTAEDHPQYRFVRLMERLGLPMAATREWQGAAPCPPRNRLVSLALRPAPVTDQWLREGPALTELSRAMRDVDLVEAASPRAEALAIALSLRKASEDGVSAALITPDRMLTRQVTAALDRWGIRPDDSAGLPLQLSAPGRFLRHVAGLFGQRLTAEDLLTLLKHPLTHSAREDRGLHLLLTRELELTLRRRGPVFPTGADLTAWAETRSEPHAQVWARWLAELLDGLETVADRPLSDHLNEHLRIAGGLAAGPGISPVFALADAQDGQAGELWEKEAGIRARAVMQALCTEAAHGGTMSPGDFGQLLNKALNAEEVRSAVVAHPGIMIWGTLEARVQGTELVILGGLNDGVWPDLPPPDPWLNRRMRHDAGLLLPDRRIGLAAHDFQQAIAAPRVILSRAIRNAEAETVPSRWLNRLTNLMGGLKHQEGPQILADMRGRGDALLDQVQRLETPAARRPPAPRPSPRPPVAARPRNLSVTSIQTLIRDPYAIYARHVLGLYPLDPLRPEPDAMLRGTVLHDVLHEFIETTADGLPADARDLLMRIADRHLDEKAPWPTTRRIWRARLAKVAGWFLDGEARRREIARPGILEQKRTLALTPLDFSLTGKVDRIDLRHDGGVVIYDYKTGKPPTDPQITHYDKQLLLEAAMVELGAFEQLAGRPVIEVCHLGLGANPEERRREMGAGEALQTWEELKELIGKYQSATRGFTSRRAMQNRADVRDYDHLARFGEWDETTPPTPRDVGR
ncbi:double-strand break repair protein AddB [Brevirhabdus sp.]|uniref:double-strand break repair protein AddB n=1 Tax=Brevirhabdus sp. TaxID=2004514 RepID=UPI004059C0C7